MLRALPHAAHDMRITCALERDLAATPSALPAKHYEMDASHDISGHPPLFNVGRLVIQHREGNIALQMRLEAELRIQAYLQHAV